MLPTHVSSQPGAAPAVDHDAIAVRAPEKRSASAAEAPAHTAQAPAEQTHAPSHVWSSRFGAAKDFLLGFVNPGAFAAVALGLSGCATTTSPRGGVFGAPLGDPGPTPPPLSQLAYPDVQLGEGHYTIASSGCLLTSLTMASALLHHRADLDPPSANRLVMAANGFSGSGLELPQAAPALGLRVLDREALSASNRVSLSRSLELHLSSGRPVVLGVDYQPGSSSAESAADHFILAYRRTREGHYIAMDPAGGHPVELVADAAGAISYGAAPDRHITEMIFLDSAPFARDPAIVLAGR